MQKKNLLEVVNSCPQHAAEALETVYRGKVFVVGRSYNNQVDGFYKTKRGAEGAAKRSQVSYYSDYSSEMVSGGADTIEEINASEILDPQMSKEIWFAWMLECLGQSYLYDMILNTAKRLNVSDEVMEYVQASVLQMKEENCLSALSEEVIGVEEVETVEQVNEEETEQAQQEVIEIATVETASSTSYRLNEQMNGIEIIFTEKPEQAIIENLKNNGFRWSRHNSLWYAKQSPDRIEFAKSLCGESEDNESAITSPVSVSYPEIYIEDIHTYVVDTKLQEAEHNSNWIFRKEKIDRTKEIQEHFNSNNKQVREVLTETDDERIAYYLKLALQRYKKKYFENYLALLRNRASTPHIAVTGRSGRNMGQLNKANSRYEKLVGESVELTSQMKQAIEKAKREIRQDKESKVRSIMTQTNVELLFQVEQKQITFNGLTEKLRTYNYGEYMIAKTWGCYRIFQNGKQVYSMKSSDKLNDAKKYVALLVNDKITA